MSSQTGISRFLDISHFFVPEFTYFHVSWFLIHLDEFKEMSQVT